MELHQKSETKESLTEHLYTIIHQNELRKAKKLTELMEKLQLEANEDSSPVQIDLSGLPSLALLNAIQTLEAGSPGGPTSPTGSIPSGIDKRKPDAQDSTSEQTVRVEVSGEKVVENCEATLAESEASTECPQLESNVLHAADPSVSTDTSETQENDSSSKECHTSEQTQATSKVDNQKDQNDNVESTEH